MTNGRTTRTEVNPDPQASAQRECRQSKPDLSTSDAPINKAVLFRVLSILWIFPSMGAVWILLSASTVAGDLEARSALAFLERVRLEQWVAVGLLALHGVFITLAWRRASVSFGVLDNG